jgi:hypothetical protein
VFAPGGPLLLAFQVGDERVHLRQASGHELSLHACRLAPERIVELLEEAGFALHAQVVRGPVGLEKNRQAHLLAHKPGPRQ